MKYPRLGNGLLQLVCVFALACAIGACSSGGEGGGTTPVASPSTGTFIDSPVQGLGYSCAPSGLSGVTNASGQYNFIPGDTCTFSLYGRAIGAPVPAGPIVTALMVFDATNLTNSSVINLAQLLLTLAGGPPAIGSPIVLPPTPPANFPTALNFSDPNFDTSFTGTGLTLVSEATATTHLSASFKTVAVTIINGGTVTSNPTGITCTAGACSAVFQTGTAVTLTATGTGFTGWSGGSGSANCTGTGTCVVTLNADSTITATFPIAPPPATVTILPNGGTGTGTVTCSANGGTFGACAPSYPNPTPLVIRATANSGSTFTGWSAGTGSAVSCNGTTVDCAVTLTADSAIGASFTLPVLNSVTATTTTGNGGGGTVQCSANGGAAGICGNYPVGSAIVMTATPNAVSNFTGWSGGTGNATVCNGATTSCAFTVTANTSITANFNRPILSVTISGTGSVTSNPAGITNCTSNCTAPFDRGASVTLTATGANFTGWSGGCSGTGTCVVTLNGNTTVTATFGAVASAGNYRFVWADGGALMAIDPAAPTATPATVVASGVHNPQPVVGGTYNSGTQIFSILEYSITTFEAGGRLWRVNSAKSAGIPGSVANPVVQVSNETGATNLCAYQVIQTGSSSTARIFYENSGADADCLTRADNVSKLTPVLADVSTPPFTLPAGTRPTADGSVLVDFTTGQVTAIFLTDHLNADTLKRLDLATNTVTTIQANVGTVEFVARDTSDRVFLKNDNQLFLYTLSNNTLTTLLTTTTPLHGARGPASDGTNIFVFEEAGKVYGVPMSALSSTNVFTILPTPTTPLLGLMLTSTRLVLVTTNASLQVGLVSLPKAGGALITLLPLQDNGILVKETSGNLVYYNRIPFTGQADISAVIVQDDGTPVTTFTRSEWIGSSEGNSLSLRTDDAAVSRIFRTAFGPSSADPYVGATMTVHNAATPLTAPVALGTVPTVSPSLQFLTQDKLTHTTVRIWTSFPGVPGGHPVLFADTTQAGSLVLVPLPAAEWLPELF